MKMRLLLGRDLCAKGPFEEDYESANERECTRIRKIVDRRLRIEDEEEADSSKGSASVSLAVSRILRGTFLERFNAKGAKGRGEEALNSKHEIRNEEYEDAASLRQGPLSQRSA